MDTFFTQKTCEKCGSSLAAGRIMSMFNTDCICMICCEKEKHDKDYDAALEANHEQIRKDNYNFKGIRSGK